MQERLSADSPLQPRDENPAYTTVSVLLCHVHTQTHSSPRHLFFLLFIHLYSLSSTILPHPLTLYHWAIGAYHCLTGGITTYQVRKCYLGVRQIPSSIVCRSKFSINLTVLYNLRARQLQLLWRHTQTRSLTGRMKWTSVPFLTCLFLFFKSVPDYNLSRNGVDEGRRICIRFVISAQMNKLCEIHCMLHTVPVLSTLYVIRHHNNVEDVAVHYLNYQFSVFQ